jgi:hypothetical protein
VAREQVAAREVTRAARSRAPAAALLRLQRTAGNAAVGRMLARARSDPPRLPGDCPGHEPGEVAQSRTGLGVLTHDVMEAGPDAMLIADFGVGRSEVKEETRRDKDLQAWIALFERDRTYKLSILGLDDCVTASTGHQKLRKARAESVRKLFGTSTQARISTADAAPDGDYYRRTNATRADRAKNRGAVVLYQRVLDFDPKKMPSPPKPPRRSTTDCDTKQMDAIAESYPVAVAMVDAAIAAIRSPDRTDPIVKALLRKYFNDDGVSTHTHARAGFLRIRRGLKTDVKFECEDDCEESTVAYQVPILSERIHLCDGAFKGDRNELASTIVHEASHAFDFTMRLNEDYCAGGCPKSLDRWTAYNNADSYAEFAQEVLETVR